MAGAREGQGARRKEGEWGEGPLGHILFEISYVFRLSVSMRKVASEHLFCVIIYMNSYIFQIYFVYFFVKHICTSNLKRFEQIELQAKLLNYFLGSNKSNINQ